MKNSFGKEFVLFLREYKVISLAVAFVMGEATSSLVSSLVKDVFLPIAVPLISAESWETATFNVGSVHIAYGTVLGDVVNFIILAFLIFIIAKKILKIEKEERKREK